MLESNGPENTKDPETGSRSTPDAGAAQEPMLAAMPEPPKEAPRETVGDILRKERITRRIAVETIAKDLRLNVRYIKSLEANQYDALPADPYVRVYLRSIAKYLMLDPEAVMKKFYEEQGVPPDSYQKNTQTKIDIKRVEKETSYTPWIVVGAVIVLLAGISLISNKMGWNKSASPSTAAIASAAGKAKPDSAAAADSAVAESSASDSAAGDTIHALPPDSGAITAVEESLAKEGIDPITVEITIQRDSSWIQVFSDGQSWKNTLKAGAYRKFVARDSINVHVGNNGVVRYLLNGKPMPRFPERDLLMFRIDRSGKPIKWSKEKWENAFKGRL
jgi:cytoskeletal protein RodZ